MKKQALLDESVISGEDFGLMFYDGSEVFTFWNSDDDPSSIEGGRDDISETTFDALSILCLAYGHEFVPVLVEVDDAGNVDWESVALDYETADWGKICKDEFLPANAKGRSAVEILVEVIRG